jgi:hypothetical protein
VSKIVKEYGDKHWEDGRYISQEVEIGDITPVDTSMGDILSREVEDIEKKNKQAKKVEAATIAESLLTQDQRTKETYQPSIGSMVTQKRQQQNLFGNKKSITVLDALNTLSGDTLNGRLAKELIPYAKSHNVTIELVDTDGWATPKGLAKGHYITVVKDGKLVVDKIEIAEQALFGEKFEQAILHEIMHSLTAQAIEHDTQLAKDFNKIYEHAKANMDNKLYGLANKDEFLSELFTNTDFIQALSKVKAIDGIKYKNLFQELIDIILKALGIREDNLYTQAFATGTQLVAADKVFWDNVKSIIVSKTVNYESTTNIGAVLEKENIDEGLELINPESDEDTYYKNRLGEKFTRLTQFLYSTFSQSLSPKEWATRRTNQEYAHLNKPYTDSIPGTGNEMFTYDQRIEWHINKATFNKKLGKLKHLYMQRAASNKTDAKYHSLTIQIDKALEEFKKVDTKDNSKWYDYIEKDARAIYQDIGSNYFFEGLPESQKDKIYTELPLIVKELGWGTTIDLLIWHSNGEYTISDWKTGTQSNVDQVSNMLLKYGNEQIRPIFDTPIARAELQIMLQAFMLKVKFPQAKSRRLVVTHIMNNGNTQYHDVDLAANLGIIESYFKDTNKALYDTLQKKGVFNTKEYSGYSNTMVSFMEETKQMDIDGRKLYLQQRIDALHYDITNAPDNKKEPLQEQLERYSFLLAELQHTFGTGTDSGSLQSWWKRNFGNLYNVTNRKLQSLHLAMTEAESKRTKEQTAIFDEHDRLLTDVLIEKGILKNKLAKLFTTYNYEQAFDFTKSWSNLAGKTGWFTPLGDIWVDKAGVEHKMTATQLKYMQWRRDTKNKLYNDVMGREMQQTNKNGTFVKTKGELIRPEGLPEDHYIYYPIKKLELYQRHGIRMDGMGTRMYNNMKEAFVVPVAEWYSEPGEYIAMKYEGNENMRETENHTFDQELAFKEWTKNMLNKKHKDYFVD